jgi:hypothetical protein
MPYVDDFNLYALENDNNITDKNKKIAKKVLSDMKIDVNKIVYKQEFRIKGKKPTIIEYYASGDMGTVIRDAVTGIKYKKSLVGSGDEDLFFKIRISGLDRIENPVFYFNSPEDYEKHSRTLLDVSIKNNWYEKYQRRISMKQNK